MNVRTYTIGDNCWTAILPAAAFGLLVRLLTGQDFVDFPVASTAFLGLLPVAIGVLPILFRKTTDTSRWRDFLYPVYAVGIFGLVTLATGIEDVICLLILGIPFLLVAGLTGLVVGYIVRRRNRRKPLVLLVVLPLLVGRLREVFKPHQPRFL